MLRALYTSATGMKAQEALIDNTANNLANVNTTGFKRSQVGFADLVYDTIRQPGAGGPNQQITPSGLQMGNGVRVVSTTKHFRQGNLDPTNNELDLAIAGRGFFQIDTPNGERYTRAGNFGRDDQGQLVTADGYLVGGGITIPLEAVSVDIGADGSVQATLPDDSTSNLGVIPLINFPNPTGLRSEGNNLFAATPASGAAIQGTAGVGGFGTISGGYLEHSTVDVVHELVSLISAQRAYEINSRAIRAGDEMLSTSADIVR